MSYLETLLDSAQVEWLPLGHVCNIFTGGEAPANCIKGTTPTNDYKYPIYGNGAEIYGYTDTFRIDKDAVTISSIGANTGTIYFREAFFTPIIRLKVIMPRDEWLLPKYIFHYLSSQTICSKKSSVPNMNADEVKKLPIPIPCPENPKKSLAIQAEIVRILDAFTSLTAELTAELTARKKQYNYYRDQLLTFSEGEVEWRTLDDIVSFRRGSFPQPYGNSSWYDGEGSMPFVQVADVSDLGFTLNRETKQRISKLAQPKSVFVKAGTVIVTLQGTIGRVAITPYDSYVDRTLAVFTDYKVDINKKYFAYQLKNKFDVEKEYARGSTLKTITKEEFSKFEIPVPPLKEQARIVSILDQFDALTNSLQEGLPREIALRQKQYEYYRDMLLNFPKPTEAA